jgi:hypothetical protein
VSSDEDDLEDTNTSSADNSLAGRVLSAWTGRKKPVESNFAIAGWALSVQPEIMDDYKMRETGSHRNAIEAVVRKLYADQDDLEIEENVDKFWTEHDDFQHKRGNWNLPHRWNVPDVAAGRSHLWHKKYSLKYSDVLGFVACRVTSKIAGIGSAERSWGDVKHLKSNKRSHLSGDSVEKQALIYSAAKCEEARIEQDRKDMAGTGNHNKFGYWGDDDVTFDLGLEKFGVDLSELRIQVEPNRKFKCWIEDWELPLMNKNDSVAEAMLLEKYKGIVFFDLDNSITYTIYERNLEYKKGRSGGWCVLGMPPGFNGHDDHLLEPYLISSGILIDLIKETDQPVGNNVQLLSPEVSV